MLEDERVNNKKAIKTHKNRMKNTPAESARGNATKYHNTRTNRKENKTEMIC